MKKARNNYEEEAYEDDDYYDDDYEDDYYLILKNINYIK